MNDDRHTWPPAVEPAKTFPETPAGDTPPRGSQIISDTSVTLDSAALADASGMPRLARLKHYRLLDLIGRGGMGDVYRAHDEQFDRTVAVKVLPPDLACDPSFVHRFQREAKALAKLSHPHIVPIYTIDNDQGHAFFAMQFVAGESLDRRLRRVGKLPLTATLRIISQCLAALQAAHDQQLVHRDIKPGNVLLQHENDHIFLVDFGLVRSSDGESGVTVSGMVMGTVDYMSPEQARGVKGIDHRADLYAVGVMLYHMLSGRLPFAAPSFQGMLFCHAYEEPFPLESAAPDLPEALFALVKRLLEKSPGDRPASCREVLAEIEPLLHVDFQAQHLQDRIGKAAAVERTSNQLLSFIHLPESYPLRDRVADRVASLAGYRPPQWWQKLHSTDHQLEAALAEAQKRIRQLQSLKADGEQVCDELRAQAQRSESAAGDADEIASFLQQAAAIQEQVAVLDLMLAKARDAQAKLQGYQLVNHARLRTRETSGLISKRSVAVMLVASLVTLLLIGAFLNWVISPANSPVEGIVEEQELPIPSPPAEGSWQDLLAATDLDRDVVSGQPQRAPEGLRLSGEQRNILMFPTIMPENYDLELTFKKATGNEGIECILPVGDTACNATFGGWIPNTFGLYYVEGKHQHEKASQPGSLRINHLHQANIRVRQSDQDAAIELAVDGETMVRWSGKVQQLSLHPAFAAARQGRVGISTCCYNDITLHSARWRASTVPVDSSNTATPQVLAAGESLELLPLAKLPDDVVSGDWSRDERGALVGTSKVEPWHGHARLQLPARPQGDYKIKVRFARLDKGDANIVFPVGDYSARATFGQMPEGGLVARGNGQDILGVKEAVPLTSSTGGTHEAHIVVRTIGEQAEVKIYVDRTLTCDWRGECKLLENNPPCAIPDARAIGLTTWGDKGTRFHSVMLQMLSGHAEISRGTKTPGSPRDVDAWLLRGQEHWKRGEIAAARIDYEQLLWLAPDQHYHRGELAALCLALGDEASYRQHCKYLLSHIDDFQQPHERLSTLRIFFLVPGMAHALSETKQQQIFDNERNSEWKDRVAILWHYRHGRWQQAIDIADLYLAQHQAWRERAQCMVLRAMAKWQAGEHPQAINELLALEKYAGNQSPRATKWTESANLVYLQIFYREATALIRGNSEELPLADPSTQPVANATTPRSTAEPRPFLLTPTDQPPNTLTPEEAVAGWQLLFDGESTDRWVGFNSSKLPAVWRVENEVLFVTHKPKTHIESHIVTVDEFADFELRLQWKVSKNAERLFDEDGPDGGIFYRTAEGTWYPHEVAPEMQVLGNNGNGTELWAAGGLWGLYPPQVDARRPLDTWNDVLIVANGSHVEHWLNGAKLLECEIGSDDWNTRVAKSKFKDMPRFSKSAEGKICLHATPRDVQYRNIKLRRLPIQEAPAAQPQTYLEGPLEPLTAAVEQNPLDPDVWIRRGRWHAVQQKWKDARVDYEAYLQLKPENMFIRRQYAELCLALEDSDLQPYTAITEHVRRLPQGSWAFDDLRTLCLIPPPKGLETRHLVDWSARSSQPTGWKKMYLIPIHYRTGDWQTCLAASAAQFPHGPQQLYQTLPCLCEAAALKQIGKDDEARAKLFVVRDFIEQGKTAPYVSSRENMILNFTFDTLHAQIFYREASELILGKRAELKAPLATDLVKRHAPTK